jgi:hypothetical protein
MPDEVTAHLDAAYDSDLTRQLLDELGLDGEIARKGVPSPIQIGKRWVVERTNSWMNGYGKLPSDDRQEQPGRRFLSLPRRRVRHRTSTHPTSTHPLPMGHTPHHPPPQMIYCRSL